MVVSQFPRVFPILDSSFLPTEGRERYLFQLGKSLADGGVKLLEYRNKLGTAADLLGDAVVLRAAMPDVLLVMDDRVDVALAAGLDGVHVDAGDLPAVAARSLMGANGLVGTSASSEAELVAALAMPVDYVAFGPVFPTTTKQTSVAPIGIEGVRRFRRVALAAAERPILVAAAGITYATAVQVLAAGADSVAVASGIFAAADPAGEFRRWVKLLGD